MVVTRGETRNRRVFSCVREWGILIGEIVGGVAKCWSSLLVARCILGGDRASNFFDSKSQAITLHDKTGK